MGRSVTEQLLSLGGRMPIVLESLYLNDVIVELQPLLSHSLGKLRTVHTNLGCRLGFVRADRQQIKQVL